MSNFPWTPWREAIQLRQDLLSGELSLSMFAADLYTVMIRRKDSAASIYADPAAFFRLTYPTHNMREVAYEIAQRLRGQSDKAVRQLSLTYGGGKTHFLITAYHLFSDTTQLPDLPAVKEFHSRIGASPRARVAAVPFDNLDPQRGMEVRDHDGKNPRRFRYPWSVLAYQIAGDQGLAIIGGDGEERDTPPFVNVMEELLRVPAQEGLGTLVLMDEVLMWVRTMHDSGDGWTEKTKNFFQFLAQAATQVKRCAVLVSLLASDPKKYDETGRAIASEISAVLLRQEEENILPVLKDDVAEVLRRRLFDAVSLEERRPHFRANSLAAVEGIKMLDESVRKDSAAIEKRYEDSYPFHPDLTDVFYSKWTNLENFQRTRGVLRTYALALRDAVRWDEAPLISTNVFLSQPGSAGLSGSAQVLADIARAETLEGKQQSWPNILEGELVKAQVVQAEFSGLRHREVEQTVFAIFLHSQPVGMNSKAQTRELMALTGATRPDKIELGKALKVWAELSWFLEESDEEERTTWRLGLEPNLKQMHDAAMDKIAADAELVPAKLLADIGEIKSFTAGVSAAGGRSHLLPERPRDVEDDGEFHFAVLRPEAASEQGAPSTLALRFLKETTGPEKQRVNKNALVLIVPSRTGLDIARERVREYLGWTEVKTRIKELDLDELRIEKLSLNLDVARKRIPDAIRQAYCIVVTYGEDSAPTALRVIVPDNKTPLFQLVKSAAGARIQETAVSAEALLPGGPYDLWRPGEKHRFVKDIVGAFAQNPRLPKMVNRRAIFDTLVQGCSQGMFVLQLRRPDGSLRTFWHQAPDENALKDPALEVVLPEYAVLVELAGQLLAPDQLPGLWKSGQLSFVNLCAYFSGETVIQVPKDGYDEPLSIPRAERQILESAVETQVSQGKLWLLSGPASLLKEAVPAGLLTDAAVLRQPPAPIAVTDLGPGKLPAAWQEAETTAEALHSALSAQAGVRLPWLTVQQVIDGAIRSRWLERTNDSGAWPCDAKDAALARFRQPEIKPEPRVIEEIPRIDRLVGEASLEVIEIQELGERIGEIKKLLSGLDVTISVRIEVKEASKLDPEALEKLNTVLAAVAPGLKVA